MEGNIRSKERITLPTLVIYFTEEGEIRWHYDSCLTKLKDLCENGTSIVLCDVSFPLQ
jgi:hypothetical protein